MPYAPITHLSLKERFRVAAPAFVLAVVASACGAASHSSEAAAPVDSAVRAIGHVVSLTSETVGAEPRAFVALAGHWRVTEDAGEKAVVVDGRAWTPGVPPPDLGIKSTTLFPDRAQDFAERARKAQSYPLAVARDAFVGHGKSWPPCFVISTEFKLIAGASDQYAAIMFGLQPDGNFLALRYNTKDGDLALWRIVDGERRRLHHGGTPIAVPLGTWHSLYLDVDGTRLTGLVDGRKALESDLRQPVAGRVGYWAKPDSVTAFRNFVVSGKERCGS